MRNGWFRLWAFRHWFANRKPFLFEVCDYIQVDNRCVASTNRYITSNMACTLQPWTTRGSKTNEIRVEMSTFNGTGYAPPHPLSWFMGRSSSFINFMPDQSISWLWPIMPQSHWGRRYYGLSRSLPGHDRDEPGENDVFLPKNLDGRPSRPSRPGSTPGHPGSSR